MHGVLLLGGVITALALVLFMAPAGVVARGLAGAALVGFLAAVVLALNLPRQGAEAVARAVGGAAPPDPGLAALAVGGVVLGLLGLVVGIRSGAGRRSVLVAAGGALVLGAVLGWFLGAMTFSVQGGVALGLALGLASWPLLQLGLASQAGVGPGTRLERLKPRETIETIQETRAWLEVEWAKRREKLGKK